MEKRITPGVLAYAAMVGDEVCDLDTGKEGAEQEARKIGGRVVELVNVACVADLISEFRAYHDRDWSEAREGVQAHTAGDLPDECEGCAALARFGGAR